MPEFVTLGWMTLIPDFLRFFASCVLWEFFLLKDDHNVSFFCRKQFHVRELLNPAIVYVRSQNLIELCCTIHGQRKGNKISKDVDFCTGARFFDCRCSFFCIFLGSRKQNIRVFWNGNFFDKGNARQRTLQKRDAACCKHTTIG